MKIGIVGLGLIGGSMAKATKVRTSHEVFGRDIQKSVVLKARLLEAIDEELTDEKLGICDLLIVALHPQAAKDFLRSSSCFIRRGCVVVDCTGIKQSICALGQKLADRYGFTFVGGHPMAGIECSGFDYSGQKLFQDASMILTPDNQVSIACLDMLKQYFLSLGFGKITVASPEKHDRIIAYTSQLAHVVSGAFVRSPSAAEHRGFSAGSFRDMTRVAKLHPGMWTELFRENRKPLLEEIDGLIQRLQEYRSALADEDYDRLHDVLEAGNRRRQEIDE